MPNRMLRDSALASKKLARVNAEAERLYWRLLMVADDFGRFDADPVVLRAKCFPRHGTAITDRTVKSAWMDLVINGLILEYTVNGDTLGQFAKWDQRVRAEKSRFPGPECGQLRADDRGVRSAAAVDEDVVVDVDDRRRRSPAASPLEGFEEFWTAYPRKKAKGDACNAWKTLRPDAMLRSRILAAVEAQRSSRDWLKQDGKFIPYPASWLRGQRWEDTVDSPASDPDALPPLRLV